MKEILIEIDRLAEEELERANKTHPIFASDHEGWAVLFEECLEAAAEVDKILTRHGDDEIDTMFYALIQNDAKEAAKRADNIRQYAQFAAAELIQVIAMCDKFVKSQKARGEG